MPAKAKQTKPKTAAKSKEKLNLITCVLQRGRANQVAKAAMQAGASGATVFPARGMGLGELVGALGFPIVPQKEVITIIASVTQTKKIFASVCQAAELDTPGMGIAYVSPVQEAVGLFKGAPTK